MIQKIIIPTCFLFLFLARGIFADQNAIINEVAWMGSAVSAADEWMELKNGGGSGVDLSGWRLEWRDGEYGITFGFDKCANTVMSADGYFLLERTNDDTVPGVAADCIYTGALSNSGERVVLKDAAGSVVGEVNASSGWPAGDNSTKQTMQRVGSSWVTATSTPRAQNYGATSSPTGAPQTSSAGSVSAPALPSYESAIRAYAGEDRVAVAGAVIDFIGEAQGRDGKPFENARFWWNFGDGGTLEGRVISHIFQIPGQYLVGLHVSSGVQAASDYLAVSVIPNQISVKGVVLGEGGFVKLSNPTDYNLDIGEWVLEDSGARKFIIPSKTKIGAKAEVAFPNVVTGLLRASGKEEITIHYPNLAVAIKWPESTGQVRGKPAIVSEKQVAGQVLEKLSEAPALSGSLPAGSYEAAEVVATRPSNLFLFIAAAFSILAAVGFLVGKKLFPWKSKK